MARQLDLTQDDVDVLRLLARGMTTDAIARELGLSARTLRRRARDICDRLGVDTPIEAVVRAVRARVI